jgi:Ser/Thr protein kinase RdoA (MazF antagonist)
VIHGDFNHCNALYSHDGAIIGLFDFDWAWRDARVRDVGDALFFFGACRSDPPDAGDIWSLTACPRLDTNSMLCFLHRYDSLAPLAVEEWAAVPLAMLGRWVAIRLEGVMKVPESRRAEFVLAGFERPFAWFDEVRNAWAQARYRRPGG